MTRRELGWLLLGLGAGLLLSVVAMVEFVMRFHHMFVLGLAWRPASLLLFVPPLLVVAGGILVLRGRMR